MNPLFGFPSNTTNPLFGFPPNTMKKAQTNDVALAVSTHVLLNEARNSNAVLSPASIQAMLSLIAAGANGPSLEHMLSFLKAESVNDLNSLSSELVSRVLSSDDVQGGPTMAFANGAWVDRSVSLLPSFKQVADEVYNAASWEVDFKTTAAKAEVEVNEWAKKHTKGTIKQVLPPGSLDPRTTKIVLANALYFKGAWAHAFDPSGTRDRDFHLSNGSSVRVPFMTSCDNQYVSQFDGFKVLSLPYSKGSTNERKFSMYIFLPVSRTGLPSLVEKMGSELCFLNRHIPRRKVKATVLLPKFKISFGIDACGALEKMGLVLKEIDLSRMVGHSDARVAKVLHKSFVEVNEQGTEAAAVTIAMIAQSSLGVPVIEERIAFVADHPFMFVIREDMTESVLFVGQVLDPSGGEEEKKNKEESRDMYGTKRILDSRNDGREEKKQISGIFSQMFGSPNRSSAFGGFGSIPSPFLFGSTNQQSQPAFGSSSLFGSATPFGAATQSGFGATSTPAFGFPSNTMNPFGFPSNTMNPFGFSPNTMNPLFGFSPNTMKKAQTNDVALAVSTHVMLNKARNSNAVLSPASIQAMLSLIAAGANGPSLDHMLSFLKAESVDQLNYLSSELVSRVLSPDDVRGGPTLAFANGAWVDRSVSLRPSFEKVADEVYKAASWEVDFHTEPAKAEVEVNEWAKKHTKGRIEQILPPGTLDKYTRIVLANALYFKGAWAHGFDRSRTQDRDFHLSNGGSVRVPFMISSDNQYGSQFDGFKVLSLPYSKGTNERRFSMYIFLPDSRTGLPALVEKMGSEPGFLNRHIWLGNVQVEFVALPKFKFSYGIDTYGALGKMGLALREVDLSRMVGDSSIRVSKVLHKSFVEVNEQGTEAAAVTVAIMGSYSCGPPPVKKKIEFVADHPFMFVIREDMTGSVLFVGQVLDPSGEN